MEGLYGGDLGVLEGVKIFVHWCSVENGEEISTLGV